MNSIFSKKTKDESTTYDTMSSLSHTKWNCKYHIVFTPKYRRKIFYRQKRMELGKILRDLIFQSWSNLKYKFGQRSFWCRGYYVDTVGKKAKRIAEYVRNQLQEDMMYDQISIKEYKDPFNGS